MRFTISNWRPIADVRISRNSRMRRNGHVNSLMRKPPSEQLDESWKLRRAAWLGSRQNRRLSFRNSSSKRENAN